MKYPAYNRPYGNVIKVLSALSVLYWEVMTQKAPLKSVHKHRLSGFTHKILQLFNLRLFNT